MMRAVGLITEYNPFHNGHLHHLHKSKEVSRADVAVAVMSGHFLQRGEAALIDKWERTRMALAAGVDLVVELPLPWACSSAPDFARGGVLSLAGIGGVDALCFGSEAGQINPLRDCAGYLLDNEEGVVAATTNLLKQGVNYPTARAEVLENSPIDQSLVATPNNILAIEYLKALEHFGVTMEPYTITRIGVGYHDLGSSQGIASATGIRKRLAQGENISDFIPQACLPILLTALQHGRDFSAEACFRLLISQIFRQPRQLSHYWLVEGGIENRLVEAADQAADLEGLIQGIKSRQLTRTRVQRMLMSILLGVQREHVQPLLAAGPKYLHLLGASSNGERFLAATRKQRVVPLIHNFSRIYAVLKKHYGGDSSDYRLALAQLQLELTATRSYGLLLNRLPQGERNRDFYQAVERVP